MRLGAITGPIVVFEDAHGIVLVQDAVEIWVGRHGVEHHRRIVALRRVNSHDFVSSTPSHFDGYRHLRAATRSKRCVAPEEAQMGGTTREAPGSHTTRVMICRHPSRVVPRESDA